MKRLKLIAMTTLITAWSKELTDKSREVLGSRANECRATIKVYDTLENRQRLMDIYDCSYKSILPIYLEEGYYKIVTENFQGRRLKKYFSKNNYPMT